MRSHFRHCHVREATTQTNHYTTSTMRATHRTTRYDWRLYPYVGINGKRRVRTIHLALMMLMMMGAGFVWSQQALESKLDTPKYPKQQHDSSSSSSPRTLLSSSASFETSKNTTWKITPNPPNKNRQQQRQQRQRGNKQPKQRNHKQPQQQVQTTRNSLPESPLSIQFLRAKIVSCNGLTLQDQFPTLYTFLKNGHAESYQGVRVTYVPDRTVMMHIYHGRRDDVSALHHYETIDLGQQETLGGGGSDRWVTISSNATTPRTTDVSQRLTTVAQWHAWIQQQGFVLRPTPKVQHLLQERQLEHQEYQSQARIRHDKYHAIRIRQQQQQQQTLDHLQEHL